MCGIYIQRSASPQWHGRFVDGVHQSGLHRPPGSQSRRHDGQLQGRGQYIALPDRGIDRVAEQPGFAERFFFPLPRWSDAPAYRTQRQIVIFAQAKPAGHGGNFVDTNFLAYGIEKDIAALRDTVFNI